jgi:hypothetical protein
MKRADLVRPSAARPLFEFEMQLLKFFLSPDLVSDVVLDAQVVDHVAFAAV